MSQLRNKITTLWLMIAVAGVAIPFSIYAILKGRSTQFKKKESVHAIEEQKRTYHREVETEYLRDMHRELGNARSLVRNVEKSSPDRSRLEDDVRNAERGINETRAIVKNLTRQIAYHARLKQKYKRAASHPWEYVDRDPPEPLPLGSAYLPNVLIDQFP